MELNKYRDLPYPQNLWSAVFDRIVEPDEIPVDWEDTLAYLLRESKGERDAEVLRYYFIDKISWSKIACVYGFSRQRTQQICSKVVRMLQKPTKKEVMSYGLEEIKVMHQKQEEENKRAAAVLTLDRLGLSNRSAHCLTAIGVHTVSELVQFTEVDLLKVPSLGRVSLLDIKRCLGRFGLSLSGELPMETMEK